MPMRHWLIAVAISALSSAGVNAAAMPGLTAPLHEAQQISHRPSLRLVQQVDFRPARIRQSGMIVDAVVAPNARLGLGLFTLTRNKSGLPDARTDGRQVKSRKLGVSFRIGF
jgi:hypothetical protein